MKIIETIENWNILKEAIIKNGYRLWQFQYNYDNENGFHAFFWKSGRPIAEVVTHNKEVQDDILSSNLC